MDKNRTKEFFMKAPVEKHDTAAWANIENVKPVSKVAVPNIVQVINAKEYVDTNQK